MALRSPVFNCHFFTSPVFLLMVSPGSPKFSMAAPHCSIKKSLDPLTAEKSEVMRIVWGDWTKQKILPLIKPVEKSWQPQDFLPDPSRDEFFDQVNELQEKNKDLPDDFFVVLAGDMITEEGLPTYVYHHSSSILVCSDYICADQSPMAVWSRAWTAEEQRHGDLLNRYLYLSGRVDMKQIEKTIHYLLSSGMDIGTGRNPYSSLIYASFQERATFISHTNTARLAVQYGDTKLAQICGAIAADEKRHEVVYCKMVNKIFELDPDNILIDFADIMKKKILMPGHLMYDGCDRNLFQHFSNVAMRIGVYTTTDYISIFEHLLELWNVEKLRGLSSKGQEAQDFLCRFPKRLKKLEERAQVKAKESPPIAFSWIFNREV